MRTGGDNAIMDTKEVLLLDVLDTLRRIDYFSAIGATSNLKKSDRSKVFKGIPERLPRPGDSKEKKVFNTTQDLVRTLGGKLKVVVNR